MRGSALIVAAVLVSPTLLGGCHPAEKPRSSGKPGPVSDLTIFTMLLSDACRRPGEPGHPLIISDFPARLGTDGTASWTWRPSEEFILGLVRRQSSDVRWEKVKVCPSVRVIDAAKEDSPLATDITDVATYSRFRELFPHAARFEQYSMPGYSGDGQRAVVLRVRKSDDRASTGDVLEVERAGEDWRLVGEQNVWTQ